MRVCMDNTMEQVGEEPEQQQDTSNDAEVECSDEVEAERSVVA